MCVFSDTCQTSVFAIIVGPFHVHFFNDFSSCYFINLMIKIFVWNGSCLLIEGYHKLPNSTSVGKDGEVLPFQWKHLPFG